MTMEGAQLPPSLCTLCWDMWLTSPEILEVPGGDGRHFIFFPEEDYLNQLCDQCKILISSSVSNKLEVIRVEENVRQRQLELLKELKELEGQVESFKSAVVKVDQLIGRARVSKGLGAAVQFQGKLLEVVQDLQSYYQLICGEPLSKLQPVQEETDETEVPVEVKTENYEVDFSPSDIFTQEEEEDLLDFETEDVKMDYEGLVVAGSQPVKITAVRKRPPPKARKKKKTKAKSGKKATRAAKMVKKKAPAVIPPKKAPFKRRPATSYASLVPPQEGITTRSRLTKLVQEARKATRPKKKTKPRKRDISPPNYAFIAQEVNTLVKDMPPFKAAILKRVLTKMKVRQHESLSFVSLEEETDDALKKVDRQYFLEYDFSSDLLRGQDVAVHIFEDQQSLTCSLCGYLTQGKGTRHLSADMLDHLIGHHFNGYRCPSCPQSFQSRQTFTRHLSGHRQDDSKINCDICGKPYTTEKSLESHRWSHMNSREKALARKKGVPVPSQETFQCPSCPKSFSTAASLRYHEQRHNPERERHICPTCGKSFVQNSLKPHMKKCGDPDSSHNSITCPICGKPQDHQSKLDFHRWSHKNAEEKLSTPWPFTCSTCGKRLVSQPSLKSHSKTHSAQKEPALCTKCGKSLSDLRHLQKHQALCGLSVEERGGRPHKCPLCGKGFLQKISLDTHLGKRSCTKPKIVKPKAPPKPKEERTRFLCAYCPKIFWCNATLQNHVVTHSSEEPFACRKGCGVVFTTGARERANHEKKCTGSRKKECEVCGKWVYSLIRHNETSHGVPRMTPKRFPCDHCDLWFAHEVTLRDHLRRVRGELKAVCRKGCGESFKDYCGRRRHEAKCDGRRRQEPEETLEYQQL